MPACDITRIISRVAYTVKKETMKRPFCLQLVSVFSLCLLSTWVIASGSAGADVGRAFGGGYESRTDPIYEQGKAVYKGRIKEYGKVKYCLVSAESETGAIKIKRKSMKRYKKQSVQALVNDLRFCEQESGKLTQVLSREHLSYLVYYLNKRYRLKLT